MLNLTATEQVIDYIKENILKCKYYQHLILTNRREIWKEKQYFLILMGLYIMAV